MSQVEKIIMLQICRSEGRTSKRGLGEVGVGIGSEPDTEQINGEVPIIKVLKVPMCQRLQPVLSAMDVGLDSERTTKGEKLVCSDGGVPNKGVEGMEAAKVAPLTFMVGLVPVSPL